MIVSSLDRTLINYLGIFLPRPPNHQVPSSPEVSYAGDQGARRFGLHLVWLLRFYGPLSPASADDFGASAAPQ